MYRQSTSTQSFLNRSSILICCILFLLPFWLEASSPIPRTLIALYDSERVEDVADSSIHQLLELPLNHLGIALEYFSLYDPLPNLKEEDSYIGVITWFNHPLSDKEISHLLTFFNEALDANKKVLLFDSMLLKGSDHEAVTQFFKRIGVRPISATEEHLPYLKLKIKAPYFTNYEREVPEATSLFPPFKQTKNSIKVILSSSYPKRPEEEFPLIFLHKNGAFIHQNFAIFRSIDNVLETRQWYLHPFRFFQEALNLPRFPIPDTTTLCGRRIFYSHIDGDGWNSISEISQYRKKRSLCAEVIAEEILFPHPDLPVTVGLVCGDLDPQWFGTEKSIKIARKIFEKDHLEPGSHTYSHPFYWKFFEDYTPEKEVPFLVNYQSKTWKKEKFFRKIDRALSGKREKMEVEGYDVPRAYANEVFDLEKEVRGSIELVNSYCPEGKKVALLQWSGNCRPFPEAMKAVEDAGIENMNGGETRFDSKFNSLAWVKPLTRQVGKYRQVYSSNSNENTYTALWKEHFYAFALLIETLKNTESPIRLKPINLYYHSYSGEKLASVNALKQNIDFIKTQKIHPIFSSTYPPIVHGFYSSKITPLKESQWKIEERKTLQTLRFDRASTEFVDYSNSHGVLGHKHLQGSLYVSLDPAIETPIVALTITPPNAFHLIESRWNVSNLQRVSHEKWSFTTQGFGDGEFLWQAPEEGAYTIFSKGENVKVHTVEGILEFTLKDNATQPFTVTIERER